MAGSTSKCMCMLDTRLSNLLHRHVNANRPAANAELCQIVVEHPRNKHAGASSNFRRYFCDGGCSLDLDGSGLATPKLAGCPGAAVLRTFNAFMALHPTRALRTMWKNLGLED